MSDNNEPDLGNDQDNFDPSSMIDALNDKGSGGGGFEMPEEIVGLKADEYVKGLGVLSGGAIEDVDSFRGVLSKAKEYDSLQKEYNSLQEQYKANENPFANDYVKELNNLHKNGATPGEIALFKKVQELDLNTMSDVEAMKLQMSMQYPDLTKSQVDAAFEKDYGDAEDWSEGDKAAMARHAIDAKKELGKLQIESKRPESVKNQEQAEKVQRQTFDYWKQIEETVGVQETYKISEELSGDEKFEFDFKLPEGAAEQIQQARLYHLMSGAVKRGDSKAYKAEMAKFTERFIYANYGKDMMRVALEQQKSTVKLAANQKHHNARPVKQGTDHKGPKFNSALEAELAKHRERL